MADDGMLLNFELSADAFAPKKTFKGGSWRDRLTAKKSAEWGRQKAKEREAGLKGLIPRFEEVQSDDEELILPDHQPRKRARIDEPVLSDPNRRHSLSKQSSGKDGSRRPPSIPIGGVVSSLFTYNPKSATQESKAELENDFGIEPSNAPLRDELATFTNLGLSPTLASHLLKKLDISAPTAIQRRAIEQLCSADTDAFIQAETGSGKTLAYLLPVVQRLMHLSKQMKDAGEDFNRESGLFAIILSPTRELSKQISSVLEGLLSCCHWIVSSIVIGGEKKKSEKARLRKGLNILVATPGRLADHLDNTEVLDVSKVRWLVLDEGDRLMELGFENDIQKIVSILNLRRTKAMERVLPGLPERRNTVLCSATLKGGVQDLRSMALKEPVSISVDENEKAEGQEAANESKAFSAPAQLKQSYVTVPPKQRLVTLVGTLRQSFKRKGSVMKCIVFISCADSVDFHFEVLTRPSTAPVEGRATEVHKTADVDLEEPSLSSRSKKIAQGTTISEFRTQALATSCSTKDNTVQLFRLHGSLQQSTRTSTLLAYTKCTEPAVLVCTDVASRGLDLPNVDLVIEYDPPFSKDDHLHRIGRTARAGKDGRAMIFLMPGCEEGYIDVLKEGRQRNLTKHDADEMLRKGFSPSSGVTTDRDWENRATDWQLDVERWTLDHPKHLEQARRAFQSHIRAYATHVAAERAVFDMRELHLGHLAKAFALRDKPGSIRVPGLRPSKDDNNRANAARKASAVRSSASASKHDRPDDDTGVQAVSDEREGRRKMQAKMKAMGGASEFNLG
ncbi:ATP-dependent RNA helicase dbp7 [Vermiconidia calcicola]|uniref:ATP-dependent RNA helicase dbp7 n=1 Tax=Vermiconidia calcicola TaxID=1690605 RepID=A0ACC3NEK1_9PEZI|nr:ATP-dependent RNA helicase dbp7 [Vermiconidia calcicola]